MVSTTTGLLLFVCVGWISAAATADAGLLFAAFVGLLGRLSQVIPLKIFPEFGNVDGGSIVVGEWCWMVADE